MSAQVQLPSPETTLAIILGASQWPNSRLHASRAFIAAAQGFKDYILSAQGLCLPEASVCDLFDKDTSASDQLAELARFLKRRTKELKDTGQAASNVLVYFVGYGSFPDSSYDFYLLPRLANEGILPGTGISIQALADIFKEEARFLRWYIILDWCFSATVVRAFMGGAGQTAALQTKQAFQRGTPDKGVALFCSSDWDTTSMLLPDESCTTFSQALLDALRDGDSYSPSLLSLRQISELTKDRLVTLAENPPHPSLYSDQKVWGDVADIPFFPHFGIATVLPLLPRRPPPSRPPTSRNTVLTPMSPSVSPPPAWSIRQAPGVTTLLPPYLGRLGKRIKPLSQRKVVVALITIFFLVMGGIWLQRVINSHSTSHTPVQATSNPITLVHVTTTSMPPAQKTSTAIAHVRARATATAHAQATNTAVALAGATATAIAQAGTPYGGHLLISDPMKKSGSDFQWYTGEESDGDVCDFKNGGYSTFGECNAYQQFSQTRFAFQIDLVTSQSCGVLIFTDSVTSEIFVQFCQSGDYYLQADDPNHPDTGAVTRNGSAMQEANTGSFQSNTIGVVVDGTNVTLYVNSTEVDSISETYTLSESLNIALCGVDSTGTSQSDYREATYSNALFWAL